MTETRTERMLRLMDERRDDIDAMRNEDGSVGEDEHAMELALTQSAEGGVWSSQVINYGEDLIAIEEERIAQS